MSKQCIGVKSRIEIYRHKLELVSAHLLPLSVGFLEYTASPLVQGVALWVICHTRSNNPPLSRG